MSPLIKNGRPSGSGCSINDYTGVGSGVLAEVAPGVGAASYGGCCVGPSTLDGNVGDIKGGGPNNAAIAFATLAAGAADVRCWWWCWYRPHKQNGAVAKLILRIANPSENKRLGKVPRQRYSWVL